jgi:beta-lactamase regulating signal transducer with metallopeptidase domain
MIDLQVKLAIVAVIAWAATRRVRPADAANAHRVWLMVVISPVLWTLGEWLFPPLAFARLRDGVLPEVVTSRGGWTLFVLKAACAFVSTVLLARLAWGVVTVRRVIRSARPLAASELPHCAAAAQGEVRESDLEVPVTAGFVRSVILLPAGWRTLSSPALEAILRHEAAHVRRRDCMIALGCGVMEALFWFSPAIWIAAARARWFAEMACDSEAAAGMDRHDYASELLALAVEWRCARRPLNALTAGADTSVARRIHLLLAETDSRWRRKILLPVTAAGLLIGMPLAAIVRVGGPSSAQESPASRHGHTVSHQLQHRH